jgi:hypothetical protein
MFIALSSPNEATTNNNINAKLQSNQKKVKNNSDSPKLTRDKIRIQRKKTNKEDPNATRYHSGIYSFKKIFIYV